jgi:hypothetical protein
MGPVHINWKQSSYLVLVLVLVLAEPWWVIDVEKPKITSEQITV